MFTTVIRRALNAIYTLWIGEWARVYSLNAAACKNIHRALKGRIKPKKLVEFLPSLDLHNPSPPLHPV